MRLTYLSSMRLHYLMNALLNTLMKEKSQEVTSLNGISLSEKFSRYKSLCNVRPPYQISEEFLDNERRFFNEYRRWRPIRSIEAIEPLSTQYPSLHTPYQHILSLWQGDITTLEVDAIVNAANSEGLGCFQPSHRCIDNLIHTYAGVPLRLECHEKMKEIHTLKTGKAFITHAYNLPSKFVIHTVGPIIEEGKDTLPPHSPLNSSGEAVVVNESKKQDLVNCYWNSLKLAQEHHVRSIAFPCISTGLFRFPKALATKIAVDTVIRYLDTHEKDTEKNQPLFDRIIFNVYGDQDYAIYDHYIKNNL